MPYDPRSSRPTPKTVPDEESAPIDGLLGPGPAGEASAVSSNGATPGATEPAPLPIPVRKAERAPSPIVQLAPLLILVAAVIALLIRRSRR